MICLVIALPTPVSASFQKGESGQPISVSIREHMSERKSSYNNKEFKADKERSGAMREQFLFHIIQSVAWKE